MTHEDAGRVMGRLARSAETLGEGGPELDHAFAAAARVLAAVAQADARGVTLDQIVRLISEMKGGQDA